jgi:FkbM family methyltransferase
MKAGFSREWPSQWGHLTPNHSLECFKAWGIGNHPVVTSQCGQAEFVSLFTSRSLYSKPWSYIDIGANDGITSSSTFLLAATGWQGLSVEPQASFAASIASRGHSSFVLCSAIGKCNKILNLHICPKLSVLSTLDDTEARHLERLRHEAEALSSKVYDIPVPVITPGQLFEYYSSKFSSLTFLKVDCEGHEKTVLDALRNVSTSLRPSLIEYENNYRNDDCANILHSLGYYPLVILDSFSEIWHSASNESSHVTRRLTEHILLRLTSL